MLKNKRFVRASFAASALALAGSASAAISTTEVTGALTEAGTAAGVVGAAVLVVVVGIKAFKYIKQAM
jgi:hypothetical protein